MISSVLNKKIDPQGSNNFLMPMDHKTKLRILSFGWSKFCIDVRCDHFVGHSYSFQKLNLKSLYFCSLTLLSATSKAAMCLSLSIPYYSDQLAKRSFQEVMIIDFGDLMCSGDR